MDGFEDALVAGERSPLVRGRGDFPVCNALAAVVARGRASSDGAGGRDTSQRSAAAVSVGGVAGDTLAVRGLGDPLPQTGAGADLTLRALHVLRDRNVHREGVLDHLLDALRELRGYARTTELNAFVHLERQRVLHGGRGRLGVRGREALGDFDFDVLAARVALPVAVGRGVDQRVKLDGRCVVTGAVLLEVDACHLLIVGVPVAACHD